MVEVKKHLSKIDFMKHYVGKSAVASDSFHAAAGQLEQIDLEDGSCRIQSGHESHWYDGNIVVPSLKKFKNITHEDILSIVGQMKFHGKRVDWRQVNKIHNSDGSPWEPNNQYWEFGVYVHMIDRTTIHISSTWSIIGLYDLGPVENIGELIFFICELEYDVTNQF